MSNQIRSYRSLVFWGDGETRVPAEKPLNPHVNPGLGTETRGTLKGGNQYSVLSPLRHPCPPPPPRYASEDVTSPISLFLSVNAPYITERTGSSPSATARLTRSRLDNKQPWRNYFHSELRTSCYCQWTGIKWKQSWPVQCGLGFGKRDFSLFNSWRCDALYANLEKQGPLVENRRLQQQHEIQSHENKRASM